jgi:hypothetical protein
MKHEIQSLAKEIDSKFDYNNLISFDEDYLNQAIGSEFTKEFTHYFSNEWHSILGEAIMDIDLPDLISRAARHALIQCEIEYIDNGDYSVDE